MRVSEIGILDLTFNQQLPLAKVRIPCGTDLPSPADDYLEERLDLNKHLSKHSAATYYARAEGLGNGDLTDYGSEKRAKALKWTGPLDIR